MARVPTRFVREVLWPEFVELNQTLENFLNDVTDRVIAEGINADKAEVEIAPEQIPQSSAGPTNLEQT
jgi:hypothetical protein